MLRVVWFASTAVVQGDDVILPGNDWLASFQQPWLNTAWRPKKAPSTRRCMIGVLIGLTLANVWYTIFPKARYLAYYAPVLSVQSGTQAEAVTDHRMHPSPPWDPHSYGTWQPRGSCITEHLSHNMYTREHALYVMTLNNIQNSVCLLSKFVIADAHPEMYMPDLTTRETTQHFDQLIGSCFNTHYTYVTSSFTWHWSFQSQTHTFTTKLAARPAYIVRTLCGQLYKSCARP